MLPTNELKQIGGTKLKTNMVKRKLDESIKIKIYPDQEGIEVANDIIERGSIKTTVTVSIEVDDEGRVITDETYEFMAECGITANKIKKANAYGIIQDEYNLNVEILSIFYRTEEPSSDGRIPTMKERLGSLSFTNQVLATDNGEYLTLENEDHVKIINLLRNKDNIQLTHITNYGYLLTLDIIINNPNRNKKRLSK